MTREAYSTDLSHSVPEPQPGGRSPKWTQREIVNAILYVLRRGCKWDLLLHDFPPYKTANDYYRQWRRRERLRVRLGRDPQPSAAIIDSQSVKTTEKGAALLPERP